MFTAEVGLRIVVDNKASKKGWFRVRAMRRGNSGRARGPDGVDLAFALEKKPALEAAETFWHETQHVYDYAFLARQEADIFIPIEAEMRGFDAGCSFWRAGLAARVDEQALVEKNPFCAGGFPLTEYACVNAGGWAAEGVLWRFDELRGRGKSFDDIRKTLAPPPPPPPPPPPAPKTGDPLLDLERRLLDLERELKAETFTLRGGPAFELKGYCLELERVAQGNPLVFKGGSWSFEKCVAEAAKTVLTPGWKSSQDICSDYFHKDLHRRKDPRAIARESVRYLRELPERTKKPGGALSPPGRRDQAPKVNAFGI